MKYLILSTKPKINIFVQDGGIMEMGAEVQFEITDVETMVREVRDHQDILRSLARTLITKTLTKKTVQSLAKDKVRNFDYAISPTKQEKTLS